ncbi:DUF1178 family protein [Pelagibacteraceae bacterium]|nr:DUF1178 family protein [Pelagibacteraceae bacterium]
MIKYILKCGKEHEFESWFLNSKEFERLKNKKLIECIYCKSKKIQKTIMSPRILKSKLRYSKKDLINKKEIVKVKNDLLKIRKFIEKNFEYVGDQLAEKVKDIYYNDKKNFNIYGTTTLEEREELREEGIELSSIPWVDKEN